MRGRGNNTSRIPLTPRRTSTLAVQPDPIPFLRNGVWLARLACQCMLSSEFVRPQGNVKKQTNKQDASIEDAYIGLPRGTGMALQSTSR